MAASSTTFTPDDITLIRARPEDPVRLHAGSTAISYGTTTALGSTISAGQAASFTTDAYIQSAGSVLAIRYDPWDIDDGDASSGSGSAYTDVQSAAYGAAGDGVTDDTDAINAAITAVNAAGGGIVYLSPCDGGYGITCDDNPIVLKSNVTLKGSGYGGRIERIGTYEKVAGDRLIVATSAINNTGIIDLYIDGNEASVTLTSTQVNFGAGYAGGDATIVVDSTAGFPSAGELSDGTNQWSYTGTTATSFTGCVGSPALLDNAAIYESVGNLTSQAIRWYPLDEGTHHQYVRFENNTVVDWPGAVVHLDDVQRCIVRGNSIYNARRGGIIFYHDCHHVVVSGNQVHSADDCIAVQANSNAATAAKGTGPAYYSITGNTCESFGITNQLVNNCGNFQGLVDSNITGNTFVGAGESAGTNKAGIRLSLSDGANSTARYEIRRVNVSGNTVYSPKGHGIYVPPDSVTAEPAQDLSIVGNQIIDAYQRSIFLDGYVSRVSIVGNSIYNNNTSTAGSMDAIRIDDAHDYLVSGNRIIGPAAQSRYGINVATDCTNGLVTANYAPDAGFSSRAFENAGDTTNIFRDNYAAGAGSVGSATTVTLRDGYDTTTITGTTTIDNITAEFDGRRILIRFAASVTVRHIGGGTGNIHLAGAADLSATAADRLLLECDGTGWYEVSRTVTA